MNIHDEEFRRMGYFLLFLLCLIIVTLLITTASYICSLPIASTQSPSSPQPSVIGRDTHSNHTTITVLAVEPGEVLHLDHTTTLCRSYDQINTLPLEGKMCDKSINNSSSCCCSICLMDYKESDLLRMLPGCGHFFHVTCVDPWLRMNLTCPVCRKTYQSV
ncbi:RING-H2 finger protein ATL70-like [Cicer arietinum]|uniref:RING-H2 finger protein ATL70-like n=1 Tax=Cicer arietinum TaxID=3827 RepID=A0A1S2XXJ5_CICAR|nr:RING-H2 finger protein ATL70-like [Cicer arietinum]